MSQSLIPLYYSQLDFVPKDEIDEISNSVRKAIMEGTSEADAIAGWRDYYEGLNALRQRYRDLREEGHSHYQAMLMSGLGDPSE